MLCGEDQEDLRHNISRKNYHKPKFKPMLTQG